MTAPLTTVHRHGDALVTIALHDEIDLSNAAQVRAEIIEALPNSTLGVVLDLSDVDFLDSAGIRLIFEIARATDARGQSLRLAVPDGSLPGEVLGHVAVSDAVPIDPDADSALEALKTSVADGG